MEKFLEQFTKMMNKPPVDLMYLMFGTICLFIINWVYDFDINKIPNFTEFNTLILVVIFLAFSYYVGRMLMTVSDVWKILFWLIFSSNRKKKWSKFFRDFKNLMDSTSVPIEVESELVSRAEVKKLLGENGMIKESFERMVLSDVFLNLNIGLVTVLLVIKFNYLLIFILLLLIFFEIRGQISFFEMEHDLVTHHYKENSK